MKKTFKILAVCTAAAAAIGAIVFAVKKITNQTNDDFDLDDYYDDDEPVYPDEDIPYEYETHDELCDEKTNNVKEKQEDVKDDVSESVQPEETVNLEKEEVKSNKKVKSNQTENKEEK